MKVDNFIDYVVIQHDGCEEYTHWLPNIVKRWNDLGIKVIEYFTDKSKVFEGFEKTQKEIGNWYITSGVPNFPREVRRDFVNQFMRYFIPLEPEFKNSVVVIGEADLMPINRNVLLKPSFGYNAKGIIEEGGMYFTNQYTAKRFRACWCVSKGEGYSKLINANNIEELIDNIMEYQYSIGQIYKSEEEYITHNIEKLDLEVVLMPNRFGDIDQLSTMRPNQIIYLEKWEDLMQFADLHAIKKSYMSQRDWDYLSDLLEEFDKHDINVPYYFMPTIEDKPLNTYLVDGKTYDK